MRVGPPKNQIAIERCDGFPFDSIKDGDAVLGWGGDQRLQLYLNQKFGSWELWRLEGNGEYQLTWAWDARMCPAIDITPTAIQWLIEHDQTRGYDVVKDVVGTYDLRELEKQKAKDEFLDEASDAVAWGLKKDGLV